MTSHARRGRGAGPSPVSDFWSTTSTTRFRPPECHEVGTHSQWDLDRCGHTEVPLLRIHQPYDPAHQQPGRSSDYGPRPRPLRIVPEIPCRSVHRPQGRRPNWTLSPIPVASPAQGTSHDRPILSREGSRRRKNRQQDHGRSGELSDVFIGRPRASTGTTRRRCRAAARPPRDRAGCPRKGEHPVHPRCGGPPAPRGRPQA